MARIKNRVREWRLRALLCTQRELSKLTGIRPSTLSKVENNQVTLSVQNAILIARVLGRSLDDLYQSDENTAAETVLSKPVSVATR